MSRGAYGRVHEVEFAYSRTGPKRYPPYVAFRYRKKGNAAYIPSTGLTLLFNVLVCRFPGWWTRAHELVPVSCMNIFTSVVVPLWAMVSSVPDIAWRAAKETKSA